MVQAHQRCPGDKPGIADIPPDEAVHGVEFHARKVLQITGIGENVQVNHPAARVRGHEIIDEVRADETCPSCDQDGAGHIRF